MQINLAPLRLAQFRGNGIETCHRHNSNLHHPYCNTSEAHPLTAKSFLLLTWEDIRNVNQLCVLLRLTYVGVFEETTDPSFSLQLLMIWGPNREREQIQSDIKHSTALFTVITSQNPSMGSFTLRRYLHQALTCALERSQIMPGQHESSGCAQMCQLIRASLCAYCHWSKRQPEYKKSVCFHPDFLFKIVCKYSKNGFWTMLYNVCAFSTFI